MAVRWTEESIKRLSDTYYNMGLEKAGRKDLGTARADLEKAVRLNGSNTQARDLLGLIYYHTGYFTEAIVQWVVSDRISGGEGLAEYYLSEVQKNGAEMHDIESALGCYNRAVYLIEDGSEDLAIMQLRKAVDLYPYFVKAYQLMALLYMRRRSFSRAERVLRRCMRYDAADPDTARYLTELRVISIRRQRKGSDRDQWNWEEEAFRHISGDDVIGTRGIASLGTAGSIIFFIAGLAIASVIFLGFIMPSRLRTLNRQITERDLQSVEEVNALLAVSQDLESQVEDLSAQLAVLQQDQTDTAALESRIDVYIRMMQVLSLAQDSDEAGACLALMQIDASAITAEDTALRQVYDAQYEELVPRAEELFEAAGAASYEAGDLEGAAAYLNAALGRNDQNTRVMYYLGMTYLGQNDIENAEIWLRKVAEDYPYSDEAEAAAEAEEAAEEAVEGEEEAE